MEEYIKKSAEIDFNNHVEVMEELKKILREIKREGYEDTDISVNISDRTSAVTMV
ncbi:MAG: hypothetical protein N2Z80_04625 [Hydrogenothermaceae bacterium]|nr:hypothetical protein [Hydrogenothermaceae bacterium]